MGVKIAAVCETSDLADLVSKELVKAGIESKNVSVTGREVEAEGNGYLVDTAEELKSDGQTIGGQTGYLVGAGVALLQGSEAIANSNGVPGLFNTQAAAGICADFVDLGIPREDHAWARSKIEADKYLVVARVTDHFSETAARIMRDYTGEIRYFS